MKNDVTCCLPWNHLATHPNGAVSLCCQARLDDASGFAANNKQILNLQNSKVIDIINSDTFVATRKKMLDGIKPDTCLRCYDAEDRKEWSKRIFENKRFNWQTNNLQSKVDIGNIEFIELRLGNVCNLACTTCNSISSSKWIKDEKKLSERMEWYKNITHIEEKNHKWFENENFYEELAEQNPNLKKIYINGGEPFLIKAHKKLLEKLIQLDRSKFISLEYSTNVTVTPTEYFELFKNFDKVSIMLSIDDIGKRNEYLRWPSEWNIVNKNIDWFVDNCLPNMNITLCQTISCLNVFHVNEFMDYCEDKKINYTSNFVYTPKIFSASSLSNNQKKYIKSILANRKLSQLDSWLALPYDKSSKEKLDEFLDNLDDIRKIDKKVFMMFNSNE